MTATINFLNNNAGITSVICALIALLGTILSAVIGRRSGKKAAEKEINALRIQLENSGIIAGDGAQISNGPQSSNVKDARKVRIDYK